MNAPTSPTAPPSRGLIGAIERIGNRLPHPFWLFVWLTLGLAVLSAALGGAGLGAAHPTTGKLEPVRNLLSREGLGWFLGSALENVAGFRPIPLVLVMLVGIGLAEKAGLLTALIRRVMAALPAAAAPAAVVFVGINGNLASDACYLIVPPLGAAAFLAAGRHPVAGLCAGLAGTGAGYTANLFVAGTDVLTSGISTQAARLVRPGFTVTPLDNWFFMATSVFLLTAIGALVTTRWLEPKLGPWRGDPTAPRDTSTSEETATERRGLRAAGVAALIFAIVVAALAVPERGWLHAAPGKGFNDSPFMHGIVAIVSAFFAVAGFTYGRATGVIKSLADVPRLLGDAVRDMTGFFVVAVAIALFLAAFAWTNLGLFLAVEGAQAARSAGFTGLPLLLALTLLTAVLGLFVSSSSALWSLLAPVFVPLLLLLGYHPAVAQVAYRIAESSTNIITPMTPYLVVLLPRLQVWQRDAGLGSLIALMVPYSAAFLTAWIALMLLWVGLGWPLGPGAPIYLPSP